MVSSGIVPDLELIQMWHFCSRSRKNDSNIDVSSFFVPTGNQFWLKQYYGQLNHCTSQATGQS